MQIETPTYQPQMASVQDGKLEMSFGDSQTRQMLTQYLASVFRNQMQEGLIDPLQFMQDPEQTIDTLLKGLVEDLKIKGFQVHLDL